MGDRSSKTLFEEDRLSVGVAGRFWDREVAEHSHVSWMADPNVREYINTAIGGSEPLWPLDWLTRQLGGRRFKRGLSIGCGDGAMERDLIRRGLCQSVDAFDASLHSLHLARTAANEEGWSGRIRYFAADFNEPRLARSTYDLVVFQQSMHHVAKLEKLLREVLLALTPDGLLYIDEYVGPSRHEWTFEHIAAQEAVYQTLPREIRFVDTLPLPIQPDDPSEAVRSGEIVPQLEVGFEFLERRDYGGNLLSIFFPAIDWKAAPPDLVPRLIDSERAILKNGDPSYCTVALLKPKRGLAKQHARFHYFAKPKLQRIGREIRQRVRG